MVQAIWNDKVIAESDDTVVIENNHYFPPESLRREFFKPSDTTTVCSWKGTARYQTLSVGGMENKDAAWHYPDPSNAANAIKGRVAFWKGVKVG